MANTDTGLLNQQAQVTAQNALETGNHPVEWNNAWLALNAPVLAGVGLNGIGEYYWNMLLSLPRAISDTFSDGRAWDSFQGAFTQMTDVMLLGATDLSAWLPPLYGHATAHYEGTDVGTVWGVVNWTAILFAPWAAVPEGTGVVVTHWGPSGMAGLRVGDWVMRGPANTMRYLLSGVAQPGRHFAWPWNFIMQRVEQSALAMPPSWEAFKWYLGQAIFLP
jgi:hypothetical protein